jgi:hypothetical protein
LRDDNKDILPMYHPWRVINSPTLPQKKNGNTKEGITDYVISYADTRTYCYGEVSQTIL